MEEGKEMPYKRFETPKPVSVGDEIDVTVESVGGQGDGIAKVDGFVVFVKGAAKGERLKVKITDVRKTYAVGEKVGAAAPAEEAPSEEKPAEEQAPVEETEPPKEEAEPAAEEAPAEEAPKEEAPAEEAPAEEAPSEEKPAEEPEEKKEEAPSE